MADALTTRSERDCAPCDPSVDTEMDRQFPRHDFVCSAEATIHPLAGQSGEPVRCTVIIRDLSDRGFGITLDDSLQLRQRVEINVADQHLVGEVQWSRQIQPQVHIVGCRLLQSP